MSKQKILLDVHAHLAPVNEAELARIPGVSFDGALSVMTVDGHAVGMKPLFQPQALKAWMERNSVARAWISAPPPLYRQQLRGHEARAWVDYINQGLAKIASESGGAFSPLFHLPTQDPAVARDVAEQAIAQGHLLFAMPAGAGGDRTLGDPEFEPLWKALDDAAAFVFFHPGECADGRLSAFYLGNLLGNPYESTVAIAHLVFSGVLGRHARFTACFAHAGGLAPMAAGRWQRGYDTARPGVDAAVAAPAKLLKRIHVDCICHSEQAAALADSVFGFDNVVFGSDWPFPMGLPEPHRQLEDFTPERRERYFNRNPARLLARHGKTGEG